MTGRERILRAALTVIGAHGIAGLTNRRVASEAGISLGSLTYHFSSQTDLLRESLLLFVAGETRRITDIAEALAASTLTLVDAAAAAERALADISVGPEAIGVHEVYVHCARDPELHEAARHCFDAYDTVATNVLEMLGVDEPGRLASSVVALVAGAQLRRLATGAAAAQGVGDGLLTLLNGSAATPRPTA